MRRLRVLVVTDQKVTIPETIEGLSDKEIAPYKTEYDVISGLENLGHEVRLLCLVEDLGELRETIRSWRPHIVFNLLEGFKGLGINMPYVVGYLELLNQPYTGCNPSGLLIADNKPLMKKILRYHRIPVPDFTVFPRGRAIRLPKRLTFPLIVKSATEHGSVGIAQASVVSSEEKLKERVAFVHETLGTDAVAEQYIDGREIYAAVLGNRRTTVFPLREVRFENLPEGAPRIVTHKTKWDLDYQERVGFRTVAAEDVPPRTERAIKRLCQRAYRILCLTGYARMDVRVTAEGTVYLLEPNPNAELTYGEDFAEAAEAAGLDYETLLQRIIDLGLRYKRDKVIVW